MTRLAAISTTDPNTVSVWMLSAFIDTAKFGPLDRTVFTDP